MKIGIDIDGVMYQFEKTARYMLREILPNSPYKTGPLEHPFTSWHYLKESGVSKEHIKWLWKEGVEQGLFRHGDLYSGTAKAMAELSQLGEIIIITHRPKQAVNDTLAWLTFQKFELSGVYIFSNEEPKSQVKCDVYLDDKPENCIDLLVNTKGTVALMDRPWNQSYGYQKMYECDVLTSCIRRVHDWQEFIDLVKSTKRRK